MHTVIILSTVPAFNCIKSNLHYTRSITPKRVTSCGAHLRGLAPGLHSSEETFALTGPGIEPQTSRTDSVRFAAELTAGLSLKGKYRYLLLVFVVADFNFYRHLPIDERIKFGFPASIFNNSALCQTFL